MRVLIAHNRYRTPGGEERHVALLEQGLRDAGVDARLFECDSADIGGSKLKRAAIGATLAYRVPGGGFRSALEAFGPNVVHFHNIWPLLTPAALRAARQAGAGVILTTHNCRFACPGGTCSVHAHPARDGVLKNHCLSGSSLVCAVRHNPRGGFLESVAYGIALDTQRRLRLLEHWVDAFIAPSAYVGHMLELAGIPRERVHLIQHGLPPAAPARGASRFAFYAGRMTEEKGIRTLLEAARIASDVPLAVAGVGPLEPEVRAADLLYLGQLDPARVAETYAEAAFAIVPSECHENFPYAALEAFAAGKPVVATNVGGVTEIVKHGVTGLVVPPSSPGQLAEAMRTLWTQVELATSFGARALQLARSTFSLDRQIERTVALYGDVAL